MSDERIQILECTSILLLNVLVCNYDAVLDLPMVI